MFVFFGVLPTLERSEVAVTEPFVILKGDSAKTWIGNKIKVFIIIIIFTIIIIICYFEGRLREDLNT